MISFCVVFYFVSTTVIQAQFDPTVAIDCLGSGDVEVDITAGASTSGKVSLYVGTDLCDEQDTTTAVITLTFTSGSCPDGPATFPALESQFYIYVSEGSTVQAGLPDEVYEVTCHSGATETVSQIAFSTDGKVSDPVSPVADVTITDMSDTPVTSISMGTNYKFKVTCQSPFVNDFDIICQRIVANDVVTLVDNGCTQFATVFGTPTHPSQCSTEAVFTGFAMTATTQPYLILFDTIVAVCGGTCATPSDCTVGDPAWGRKRRKVDDSWNSTIETVHLYKQIMVYPPNISFTENEITTTSEPKQLCVSYSVGYLVSAALVVLTATSLILSVLLLRTCRRSRSLSNQGWARKSMTPTSCSSRSGWR